MWSKRLLLNAATISSDTTPYHREVSALPQ